ncbi:hypothetical protein [Methylobacterium mesophilicum]|uniref:hypothetical protein n=1 Tax=Methylobacterium mesophilicum TaxID=39956 RepID=UPI001EE19BBF|nr:hypothetical protein [Methylobacterium mesophilicum]
MVIEPGEAARVLERYAARKAGEIPTRDDLDAAAASLGNAAIPPRREAAILRREQSKPAPVDYDQRSLYARPETFELIRKLAFEKRTTMQALYREGLFLMLQRHGQVQGKRVDDM